MSNPTNNTKTPDYISEQDKAGVIGKRYKELEIHYHQKIHRERTVQFINAILSSAAVGVEILILILIQYAMRFELAWIRFSKQLNIFLILFIILCIGMFQFRMIAKWNKVSKNTKSLTQANYEMINHIQIIQGIVILLLIFCGVFFWVFFNNPPPPYPISQLPRIIKLWRTLVLLRRISLLIIIGYTGLELIQLYRWEKQMVSIKKLEQTILKEMPELTFFEAEND